MLQNTQQSLVYYSGLFYAINLMIQQESSGALLCTRYYDAFNTNTKPFKFTQKTSLARNKRLEIRNSNEYENNLRNFLVANKKEHVIILV